MSYDGLGLPARPLVLLDGVRMRARRLLGRHMTLRGEGLPELRFRVDSIDEYNRVTHAFAAEPGTVAWLRETLRPGDVFFDIGANIGIFTMLAAKLVGPAGRVIPFEPHAATLPRLLGNVLANDVADRVSVLSCPLHDRTTVAPFHYRSLDPASGLSQLDRDVDPFGRQVGAEVSELKMATTVDALLADAAVPTPGVIKLDVDGNEPAVLRGMARLLRGNARPRTLQVEVNPAEGEDIVAQLADLGYDLLHRHHTSGGLRMIREGRPEEEVHFNGVFAPRP